MVAAINELCYPKILADQGLRAFGQDMRLGDDAFPHPAGKNWI